MDTLNIIESYSMQTVTHWLNLCKGNRKIYPAFHWLSIKEYENSQSFELPIFIQIAEKNFIYFNSSKSFLEFEIM